MTGRLQGPPPDIRLVLFLDRRGIAFLFPILLFLFWTNSAFGHLHIGARYIKLYREKLIIDEKKLPSSGRKIPSNLGKFRPRRGFSRYVWSVLPKSSGSHERIRLRGILLWYQLNLPFWLLLPIPLAESTRFVTIHISRLLHFYSYQQHCRGIGSHVNQAAPDGSAFPYGSKLK